MICLSINISLSLFLSFSPLSLSSLSLSLSHSHSHNLAVFYSHIFLISSIHLSLFPFSSDLLFKATDLEGIVVVTIPSAKRLREPVTWFNGTYVFPLTQLSLHPARFLFLFLWLLSLSPSTSSSPLSDSLCPPSFKYYQTLIQSRALIQLFRKGR